MTGHPDDVDPLVVWAKAQYAIWDRWLGGVGVAANGGQGTIWARATGNVDEALSASAKATFLAQALWARRWAEQVASDPRSSKIVVETAHQLYELVTACTEAKSESCGAWFAALRCLEPERLAAPWLTAWQTAMRGGPNSLARGQRLPAPVNGSAATPARKELPPPKSESR